MSSNGDIITTTTVPKTDIEDEKFVPRFPNNKLSEQDCLELSRYIFRTWKIVGILLGFEMCDLDEIEMNHPYDCRIQATSLLIKWTQREVNGANLNSLISIFERLSVDFPS